MARYIDADKLSEALQEEFEFEPTLATKEQDQWFKRGIKCAIRNVDRIPTADVVEVKHGTWSRGAEPSGSVYAHCSACNRKMNSYCYGYAHCPLCGAKMDGGKAE